MNKKKIKKSIIAFCMVVALCISMSTPIFATNSNNEDGDIVTIIDPNIPSPFSYIDPPSFTFTGSNRGSSRTMDGRYLAYEITVGTDAEYVLVETWVDDVRVNMAYVYGAYLKTDWIDMGYHGNHKV